MGAHSGVRLGSLTWPVAVSVWASAGGRPRVLQPHRIGRPPYSPGLEAVLDHEVGLTGTGRLLDAGCWPGILTVRLAPLFAEAVGLDPDADMLAKGRRAAEERGLSNARWAKALAEDLPEIAPGPYRPVTFGQPFHWTDEQRVAEKVHEVLEPGGAITLIVHSVAGRA